MIVLVLSGVHFNKPKLREISYCFARYTMPNNKDVSATTDRVVYARLMAKDAVENCAKSDS